MKIALAQLNPTVGALRQNAEKVRQATLAALELGADLVVTPEMVLTGYPPLDLLLNQRFVAAHAEVLCELAQSLPLPALIGTIQPSKPTDSPRDDDLWEVPGQRGGRLANAAVFVENGNISGIARKSLLPTYDVFDEWRYFRPGDPAIVNVKGLRLGVTICEDIWDEGYSRRPVKELALQGVDALINLSASPWHSGQVGLRRAVLARQASSLNVPLLYCNLVGGQDELVFDGRSLVVDRTGTVVLSGPAWTEGLIVVDLDHLDGLPQVAELGSDQEEELFSALVCGLRDYSRKCGFSSAVLGLSGGVDSALVACIAAEALGPANVMGIAMPSQYTADISTEDAQLLADELRIGFCILPIEESVQLAQARFETALGPYRSALTRENLQSRERGKTLMEFSNDRGALLLATGNKTEYALGYSTLYGDMCGGLAVIGDLNKLEVYALAKWINLRHGKDTIPQRTLTRLPSAELAPDQIDPFDYEVIAPLVDCIVEEQPSLEALVAQGFSEKDINSVLRSLRQSEFKRKQAPPILRVSARAFGMGRRMPIVNDFM